MTSTALLAAALAVTIAGSALASAHVANSKAAEGVRERELALPVPAAARFVQTPTGLKPVASPVIRIAPR